MTYRPEQRIAFGPPLRERLPSLAYFGFAVVVTGVIVYGQNAPSSSRLFQYVVEGDRSRLISSSVCAIILFVSALAAVLREQMRGVIVHPDGIEMRELFGFGLPRFGVAPGPWLEARASLRWADSGEREESALIVASWHGFFLARGHE